jgi:iron complex outermembrane recepter protein
MKKLLLATSAFAILATPAIAQDDEREVIIVTAQKREQAITDVPLAITAYGQAQLDELGVQQFDDLADFVPGLEVQEQSANNPGFVIRGITSDSGEATIEPRVSIYQDGVSIARSRGSFIELHDSSVEVVRGPQPTLFGRSALIGAINVTSNKVDLSDSGTDWRVGLGNLNYRFAEAVVNQPFKEDVMGVRFSTRWKEREGYVENLAGGESLNGYETFALRASFRAQPTDALDVNFIIDHQTDDNPGTSFKSGAFLPSPTGSLDPWEPANLNTFGGFMGGRQLGLKRDVNSYTALVDYDINDTLVLSSVTNFRKFDSSEVFDPDGFGSSLFVFAENAVGEQFSQELRLGFEDVDGFSGFVGASYFEEDGFQNVPLAYDLRNVQALLGGFLAAAPGVAAPVALLPQVNANPASPLFGAPLGYYEEEFTNFGDAQAYEFFADATYEITDRLALTAGVRYTEEKKVSGYSADALAPSNLTGAGVFLGTGIFANGNVIEQRGDFDGTTWRLAADYQLTDEVKLFANFASGRRPEVLAYNLNVSDPTPILTGNLNPAGFSLLPAEEVEAYEVGAKGSLLGGLISGDISAYSYQYENFQTSIINGAGQVQPINAGNASAYGLETQVSAIAADWAEFFLTHSWTDATFDDTDSSGNAQIFAGNTFRLQPEHKATLGGRFTGDTRFGKLAFTPIYSYRTEVFFNNDNAPAEAQDSFGLLDLRLSLTDPDDRYVLEFFMENALDEEYIIDAGNTGRLFGIPTFIAGAPQTYGLYLSGKF